MNALFFEKKQQKCLWVQKLLYLCSRNQKRDVAQLASAPRSGRGGRKFESSHPDYKKVNHLIFRCLAFGRFKLPGQIRDSFSIEY